MKKLSFYALILSLLLILSCQNLNKNEAVKEKEKADPWKMFYKLVPDSPAVLSGEGGLNANAEQVIYKYFVYPQIKANIDDLIKTYGEPDSISWFRVPFPQMYDDVFEKAHQDKGQKHDFTEDYKNAKFYYYQKLWILVLNKEVIFIIIDDPQAKQKILAPAKDRISNVGK